MPILGMRMTDQNLERQVGLLILSQRQRSKLTRKQTEIVAGIAERRILRIERGIRTLRFVEAIQLSSAFNCKLEDFWPGQDNLGDGFNSPPYD